jgi:hypothetical protein
VRLLCFSFFSLSSSHAQPAPRPRHRDPNQFDLSKPRVPPPRHHDVKMFSNSDPKVFFLFLFVCHGLSLRPSAVVTSTVQCMPRLATSTRPQPKRIPRRLASSHLHPASSVSCPRPPRASRPSNESCAQTRQALVPTSSHCHSHIHRFHANQ